MKKNAIVKYRDKDHTYWRGKKSLTSVNKVLSEFGFEYNKGYWLVHKALEANVENFYKKFFSRGFDFEKNMPTQEQLEDAFINEISKGDFCLGEATAKIKDDWEFSIKMGTLFHETHENLAYKIGHIVNPFDMKEYTTRKKPDPPKGYDGKSSIEFLENLEDGVYVELILFSLEHMVAGQADEVFIETINGIRYIDIGDHKTNRKKPEYRKGSTCHFPLHHLYDCTYTKYWMQVSMYAYLLEQFGYKVRNIAFYHYTDYIPESKRVVTFKYLNKECKDVLSTHLHFKEN